jgi:release factor glutamine methyltransferase
MVWTPKSPNFGVLFSAGMKTSLLSEIADRLALFSDTPELDASILLAQTASKPRTWVMAHPEIELTAEQQKKLDDSLARLERGESFPYVLGKWEFFGNEFEITKDVLIPRPETELLVEKAIAWLQSPILPSTFPLPERSRRDERILRVADIGTGSGVIAISIALHIPTARIIATDISSAALDVARRNAEKFNVQDRIEFIECDLLPTLNVKRLTFNIVCANLPYIPTETLHQLSIYGREPTLALDGGKDGLDLYRHFLQLVPDWLAPNGMILLEIEATRGVKAMSLAYDTFSSATIHLHQDLASRDRLLEITPR